jgi:hypothetical protein
MKQIIRIYLLILLGISSNILIAQDLRINRIDNLPDTSLFLSSINSRIYFQFNTSTLATPFTVYFNYSVNGIVQSNPLDSFIYSTPIGTELFKDVIIQTNAPIYRKGDNIVVVWPICYQATHTANYFRKNVFVTDSLNTSINNNEWNDQSAWQVIYDNENNIFKVSDINTIDFPVHLKVYESSGRLIYSEKMNENKSMSLPQLTPAIYIFELRNKSKKQSGRFLVY